MCISQSLLVAVVDLSSGYIVRLGQVIPDMSVVVDSGINSKDSYWHFNVIEMPQITSAKELTARKSVKAE
jgi:hypothetical protein